MAKNFQFLVVTMNLKSIHHQQTWNNLEQTFDKAKDWLRFSTGVYFLFTALPPGTWYERIKNTPDMPSSFSVLIAPVDLASRSGQNTKRVWNWIRRNIARQDPL